MNFPGLLLIGAMFIEAILLLVVITKVKKRLVVESFFGKTSKLRLQF